MAPVFYLVDKITNIYYIILSLFSAKPKTQTTTQGEKPLNASKDPIAEIVRQALLEAGVGIIPIFDQSFFSRSSQTERFLVKTEKELQEAIEKKNRKMRGRIFNGLHEMDESSLLCLLELIDRHTISQDGVLVKNLINSFVEHGKAKKLFEHLFHAIFISAETEKKADRFLITLLHWLGSNLSFSSSLVKEAKSDKELEKAIAFTIFYCLKHGLDFQPAPAGTYHFPWILNPEIKEQYFAWPLQPCHLQWIETLINPIREKWQEEEKFLDTIWEKEPDWSVVDRLWERLESEAIYGLHLDGDHIRFNLPEMAIYRLTGVTLKKGWKFPEAEVLLHSETFGTKQDISGRLVDGRLDFAPNFWCEYAQWYITLAIIIGYYQVITGQDPDQDPWYSKCHAGKKKGEIERRPAKPHFYTLRPGHKASDEARRNCLYYFGRELAPGKTFRVGKKMVIVTKPRISTVVTPQGLERHLAG